MRQSKLVKTTFFVAAVAFTLNMISCASGTHGTLILYEMGAGKRLPAGEVAHMLMHELRGLERHCSIHFDSPRNHPFKDTLEMLPGPHVIQLCVTYDSNRNSRDIGNKLKFNPSPACLQFDIVAEAGHQYEFRIIEYTLSDWEVDLVDQRSPDKVVHGRPCPKQQWWRPFHD